MKRSLIFIGLGALSFILGSCAGPSRVDMDFGSSFRLAKSNQLWNSAPEKNIEPVTGLDGQAAQATLEKYRKDFEKPVPSAPFILGFGTSGKKQ
jgi:hypothetical protein